jgi:uncharacterized damage-inducible protein DinB
MATLSSDPLDILLAHDDWATRLLLARCMPLSRDQFHQPFDIGLGSLHLNFTHIISVVRRWSDRLEERPVRPALHAVPGRPDIVAEAADRTPDQLLALHAAAAEDLAAVARRCRDRGLHTTISLLWPGADGTKKRYTLTRGAVLVHIATHGAHHRAQCLNMMKRLSVPGLSDNLPDPSVVDWQSETESPPVAEP